jgi:hypothetical protein
VDFGPYDESDCEEYDESDCKSDYQEYDENDYGNDYEDFGDANDDSLPNSRVLSPNQDSEIGN